MLLIRLKSKFNSEEIKLFAIRIDRAIENYNIEVSAISDMDKLEEHGYDPDMDTLSLSHGDFLNYVKAIENVG